MINEDGDLELLDRTLILEKTRVVDGMHCMALFSPCEAYRYFVSWIWDGAKPALVAWMLNPSTATHEVLDPTVSGIKKRAEARGLGGFAVINLFAYRATDPRAMKAVADPVGPMNDLVIAGALQAAAGTASPVFAGWGAHGNHRGRAEEIMPLIENSGLDRVHAFKINKDGSPQHPLYVAHALTPVTWWSRE